MDNVDPTQLLLQLHQTQNLPLHVVPMMSPASSAPSSASSASPPLAGGKRANSPEESQSKKARLSPEIEAKLKKIESKQEEADETSDSLLTVIPTGPVSENTVFCQVPGRLAILNANTKYPVTVGEIKRRLGNPERLNTSVMGGILRRAKAKNGGKELRELLEGMGLDLPMGKRKAISMTLFTPMVEGEALHLAKDFDHLCANEFPVEVMADHFIEINEEDKKEKKQKLESALDVLKELKVLLQMDRSPLMNNKTESVLPQNVQDTLTHFSMCTHGFGTPALIAAMNVLIKILDTCVNKMSEADQNLLRWQAFCQLAQMISLQANGSNNQK